MTRTFGRLAALGTLLLVGVGLAPEALAQFTVTASAGGPPEPEAHVRLEWTSTGVPGELYEIRRTLLVYLHDPVDEGVIAVRPEGVTTFLDTNTLPGTTYEYCVKPVTSDTPEACAYGLRDLRPPTGLSATDSTRTDGVALRWTDRSSVEVGYAVFRGVPGGSENPNNMERIGTVGVDMTGFLDETAAPLTPYNYCVGMLYRWDGGETGVSYVPSGVDYVPPGEMTCELGTRGTVLPPTNVAASDGLFSDRVRITWRTPAGATASVYRAASGGPRTLLASALTGTTYDDTDGGLVSGTDYTYCVTATKDATESVSVCDAGRRGGLAYPDSLVVSNGTSDSAIEYAWNDPGDTETGFRLYRQFTGGRSPWTLLAELPRNRTHYTDTSAIPGETYDNYVVAIATTTVDGVEVTTESAPRYGTTIGGRAKLLAPTAFAATDAATGAEGSVDLSWESSSDVVQLFRVLRDGVVLATLEPYARSYRDLTALSGVIYTYKVQSISVVGVDAAAMRLGLAPILSQAKAEREALAADRAEALEISDEAVARVDARAAEAEAALVDDVQTVIESLGVDATALASASATLAGSVEIRDSNTDAGSRVLKTPGALTATTTLENRVRITWEDRSGIESDYEVHALYTPSDSVVVYVGPNRTEWVDISAPAGADVTYRVRALDRDPAVATSASAWATVVGRRVLAAPTDLAAVQTANETEILVTWTDQSRAETGYLVSVALADGAWVGTTDANVRQLLVPIQPADFGRPTTLNLIATAENGRPNAPSQSVAVAVTTTPTLLAPRVVTASTDYAGQVVVSWTDDSDANDGYLVTRDGVTVLEATGDVTTYVDDAPPGQARYCVVPTRAGWEAARPAAVCATGRSASVTVASTGDVVADPVVASGLDAPSGSPGFGSRVAASNGVAVVAAPRDHLTILPTITGSVLTAPANGPRWAVPYGDTYLCSGQPIGCTYPNYVVGYGAYRYTPNPTRWEVGTAGEVSIFRSSESGWSDVARIQIDEDTPFTYGEFGADVDIEGDVILVGAPGAATYYTHPTAARCVGGTPGANPCNGDLVASYQEITFADGGVYIYRPGSGDTWERAGMLRANRWKDNQLVDVTSHNDLINVNGYIDGAIYHNTKNLYLQGYTGNWEIRGGAGGTYSTSVSRFGERVALTSQWAFVSFLDNGVPKIATYRAADNWDLKDYLAVPSGFDSGTGGALDADGVILAIGAGPSGRVHLHEISEASVATSYVELTKTGEEFGAAVAVEGDLLAVGAPAAGRVYLYRKDAGSFTWAEEGTPLAGEAGDARFGTSLSISNGVVVVGAETPGAPGAVYTFRNNAGTWEQTARLTPDGNLSADAAFGAAAALAGDDLVIGAPNAEFNYTRTGAVYFARVGVTPGAVAASDARYANRVQVRWSDEASFEDGYRVYRRGPDDQGYVLVGTLDPDAEVYDDFDVAPGTAYSYCVASFQGDDESDTNPLGESARACDIGYTPANGTISGRLATGEGAAAIGAQVCLTPGLDQAVMFDGLGGNAVVSDFGALPQSFTLEAWVNADNFGDDGWTPVAGIDGASSAMLEIVASVDDAAIVRFRITNAEGVEESAIGIIPSHGWHHVAATFESPYVFLYVDGVLAVGGGFVSFPGTPAAAGTFRIAGNATGQTFDGRLDDIRVWSRALTAAEVADEAQNARPLKGDEPDLYAYWAMEQGSGRILTDLTAGGRHATLRGGAEWTREAAPLNACAVTDGDGNYSFAGIRYGETTAFRVVPTDPARQFTPVARTATLTPNSPTTNLVDFTETSAYTVRGRVVHPFDAATWPGQNPLGAADVEILVDGTVVGTTESDGTFAVAVSGSGQHVFEARNDSLALAFTARLGAQAFADGTAELAMTGDLDGLIFESTTRRALVGQAGGGCGFGIGTVTYRVYTDDRRFEHVLTTDADGYYALLLPPLEYKVEFVSVAGVPPPLTQTAVTDYFRHLGVLRADLTAEADTVDFRYRAPITLAVEGLPATAATCSTGFTVYDAAGNAGRRLPNVPVIGEYERLPLVVRAYENYGAGNTCAVTEGTVVIYDGFADATDTPVELTLDGQGKARYTTFGRSPDTFAGRTIGGVDRSYQKSLTAVLEIPDAPSVTTTEWAYVEGFREKPSTFVTATTDEIPLMVLRDPPGSQSSAFVEEGTSSCVNVSAIRATTTEGGASFDISFGFKAWIGFLILTETDTGFNFSGRTMIGGTTEQTLDRDANIQVCASTTERLETNGGTGWSGEDVYTGVGLNLIFAEADVVTADAAACRIDLSTTIATDLDERDPFETTFTYGKTHIESVLVPQLEQMASILGGDTQVEGEIGGNEEAVSLRDAIANWNGMITYNDSLVTEALAGEVENRSFSGGTSFQYGTSRDTTWTTTHNYSVFFKQEISAGPTFEIAGNGASLRLLLNINTETKFNRTETESSSFSSGYTLADDDAGDYFTVDVAQDPRYGTYVFNTVSGASSNPWEGNTQKRDLPVLAVDPPLRSGLNDGDRAVFTLQLSNASESGERREYVIEAPGHLNPSGATIEAYGAPLTERRYLVDAGATVNIPITVERGPGSEAASDTARVGIVAYSPFEHDIWQTAPFLNLQADTVRFEARFTPLVAPLRLTQPLDGWAVTSGAGTVNVLLSDIDLTSQTRIGVAYRRVGGNWTELSYNTADLAPGTVELPVPWTPDLADGAYELRAFAYPLSASQPPYVGPSVPGVIDRTVPVTFGAPEPADLVLALGETIGVSFEEAIDCTRLRDDVLAGVTTGMPLVELELKATGFKPVLDVGCAERTVLFAPRDAEDWDALEGQLVTARLRGVRDLVGNVMAPLRDAEFGWGASWAFTVRRNAFGWTPAVDSARVQPGQATPIRAALVNGRAQPVTYQVLAAPDDVAVPTTPFLFQPVNADGSPASGAAVPVPVSGLTGTVVSGDVQPLVLRWPAQVGGTDVAEGRYRATIYVRGTEAGQTLPAAPYTLTVIVAREAPDWVAHGAAFEHSMTVVADLRMAGATSDDPDDRLAAFVDGEVRGVASPALMGDVWRVPLQVYGTGANERVTFQAWDASERQLHTTTSQAIAFTADTSVPLVIEAPGPDVAPLEVELPAGWTWISTNREGTSSLASALLGVGSAETDQIQAPGLFSLYTPGTGWSGGVTGMDPGTGYHIRLAEPATMAHPGALVDPSVEIPLVAGWNWIGYLPATALPINDALGGTTFHQDDEIKNHLGYAQYVDGFGWFGGDFDTMEPGLGYQLRTAEDATLVYGTGTAPMVATVEISTEPRPARRLDTLPEVDPSRTLREVVLSESPATVVPVTASATAARLAAASAPAYPHSMTVTATFDDAPEGLHVAAYAATETGEELRGLAPVQQVDALGGTRAFLLVSGPGTGETITLRPVTVAEDGTVAPMAEGLALARTSGGLAAASFPFETDGVVGTAASPVVLSIAGATAAEDALPLEVSLSPARPNPAATAAAFEVALPAASRVHLVVYDVLGREVAVLADGDHPAGRLTVRLDAAALAVGTYVARLTADGEVRVRTFTVAR